MNEATRDELAATAARFVVEEGLEYGQAKRRAAKDLGVTGRHGSLPDNETVEAAVREHLALFHADTQPAELAAMRSVALLWMERLEEFRPHVIGAVWRGTATRLSAVHLELYCDDSKSAEMALLNRNVDYDVTSTRGPGGREVDVLRLAQRCDPLGEPVTVFLTILDHDDLRGALRTDGSGRSWRGGLAALRKLVDRTGQAT
jgi:hypothetical protein